MPRKDIAPGDLLVVDDAFDHRGPPMSWLAESLAQSRLAAARAGDAGAQFQHAETLRLSGSEPSGEALQWYRKAADQGHVEALLRAGTLLHRKLRELSDRNDPALEQAASEVYRYYVQASAGGCVKAQLLLAEFCMDGKFMEVNRNCSATWARRALESGAARTALFAETFFELAECFLQGKHGPMDQASAFFWLQVAADAGSAKAQYMLGRELLEDLTAATGNEFAAEWLQRAADQDHEEAQFLLGVALAMGQGLPKNDAAAAEWFREAAVRGHALAQYNLAIALEEGRGLAANASAAEAWFQAAATQGVAEPGWNWIRRLVRALLQPRGLIKSILGHR
ncbi:ybeQ [Symbiodinium sp. CCMP2592]|nr:ybeQ [Symbiodinium sp. CCMP2592]